MQRTTKDGDRCTGDEARLIQFDKCPDCEGPLSDGPSGGLSINMYCASPRCGSRFNVMGPFGVDRISDASPELVEAKPPIAPGGPYR